MIKFKIIIALFASCFITLSGINSFAAGTNAADIYKQAEALSIQPSDDYTKILNDVINNGWQDDATIKKIIEDNKEAIAKFKEAALLEHCDFGGAVRYSIEDPFPNLKGLITLTRLVLIEGRLYEKDARWNLALENYLAALKFSVHLDQQQNETLFYNIVARICREYTYACLSGYIKRKDLDNKDCKYLLNKLVAIKNIDSDPAIFIDNEKEAVKRQARGIDASVGMHSDKFMQEYHEKFDRLNDEYFNILKSAYYDNQKLDEYITKVKNLELEAMEGMIPFLSKDEINAIFGLSNAKMSSATLQKVNSPEVLAKLLISFSRSQYVAVMAKIKSFSLMLDLLVGAAVIRLYELQNNKALDNPAELVPAYLPATLTDPFNDLKPLKYIKKDKGWVLYSIGPDRKDDNAGIIYNKNDVNSKGDIVFFYFN